jgi:hypothetical protein
MYQITPIMRGPFRKYELRRGSEYIGEFPTLQECEAIRDASEAAGTDDFVRGYVECIYFSGTGEDGQPENNAKLSPQALQRIAKDCAEFKQIAALPLAHAYAHNQYDEAQAGRDLWFTRNGHGVGFWDRRLGAVGDDLARDARSMGQCDAYAGDDGLIYLE